MTVNWRVRFKNKTFWVTLVPLIILLIVQVGDVFGIDIDLSAAQDKILSIISIIFMILTLFGVVNDPTTDNGTLGLQDSDQAKLYDEPKKD